MTEIARRQAWLRCGTAAIAGVIAVAVGVVPVAPAAAYAPNSPSDVVAVAGDGRISLSWSVPAMGGTVTAYAVSVIDVNHMDPAPHSCVVSGLTAVCDGLVNGVYYQLQVTSLNGSEASGPSSLEATPVGPPAAPALQDYHPGGDGSVTVEWSANVSEDADAYAVATAAPASDSVHARPCERVDSVQEMLRMRGIMRCPNLRFGVPYVVTLHVRNRWGSGPSRTMSLTPHGVPSAPTLVDVVPGASSFTAYWAPSRVVDPTTPTWYEASASTSPRTGGHCRTTGTLLVCTMRTGLRSGVWHQIATAAVNRYGSTPDTMANLRVGRVVKPGGPAMPQHLVARVRSGRATVTWRAPRHTAMPAARTFQIEVVQTSTYRSFRVTLPASARSYVVRGLRRGSTYEVHLRALNARAPGADAVVIVSV